MRYKMQIGYMNISLTKHISPNFFYIHEFQKKEKIIIIFTMIIKNLVDLFIKSLSTNIFKKLI
jgi:hypothetical protein